MALVDHAVRLLDFGEKLDINLLDRVVGALYNGAGEEVGSTRVTVASVYQGKPIRLSLIISFVSLHSSKSLKGF